MVHVDCTFKMITAKIAEGLLYWRAEGPTYTACCNLHLLKIETERISIRDINLGTRLLPGDVRSPYEPIQRFRVLNLNWFGSGAQLLPEVGVGASRAT